MDNGSPAAEPSSATRRLYRPTPLQIGIFAVIGAVALGCGFYVRYRLVEQSAVGIACQSGSMSTECSIRRSSIVLFEHSVFGLVAMAAAVLNLYRPSAALIAIALFTGGLGIVLYNVALSALALTLLILCLARPVPGRD
jgi:hypothetical protein